MYKAITKFLCAKRSHNKTAGISNYSWLGLHAPYARQLLRLAFPILVAHMIEALIPFINMMLAGRHGALSLGAAGLAGSTFVVLIGFGWGIIVSVAILTAHRLGKKNDPTDTGGILKASMLTSLLVSLPIMGLMKCVQPLWLFCGQTAEVAQLGQSYLDGLVWVVFADLAKFSIFQFSIAHHKPGVPLVASIICIPLIWWINQALLSHWGLYGLGVGTAIVYWVVLIILWTYLRYSKTFGAYITQSFALRDYPAYCWDQLRIGVPLGAIVSIELLFSTVMGVLMGQLGNDQLTAHQIAQQWLWFTIMIAVGFSEAVTILVARARAWQDNTVSVLEFVRVGVIVTGLVMLLVSCIYWLAPQFIINLDLEVTSQHEQLIQLTTVILMLCGFYQILDGIRIVLSGGLRGLADTQYPMWLAIISFWLFGFPIAYISAFILDWKGVGIWAGMIAAQILMISLQYRRLHHCLNPDFNKNSSAMSHH